MFRLELVSANDPPDISVFVYVIVVVVTATAKRLGSEPAPMAALIVMTGPTATAVYSGEEE